jgi:bifunctional DNA-binding transcriptional regulator/antitoxin component of YhaV-PrlF toxin-antitoxin module
VASKNTKIVVRKVYEAGAHGGISLPEEVKQLGIEVGDLLVVDVDKAKNRIVLKKVVL